MEPDDRVETTLHTLEHASPAELTEENLAQAVNLSVSRLRHLIKQEAGVPLGRLLKARQMEPVKRLLAGSLLSVKEVMKTAGFAEADETSFIRGFKNITGVTPGEFRRLARATQRRRRAKIVHRRAA